MIGIFDSGVGGLASLAYIKEALPTLDTVYIADTANAPFGTKSEAEVLSITANNIKKLSEIGAKRILIACCTASTVHKYLPQALSAISVPIIEPTARCAALTSEGGKIGVIATERTVRSLVFDEMIQKYCRSAEVISYSAGELVGYIEGKEIQKSREYIDKVCERILADGCDTLILGCTHFSHAREYFASRLSGVSIIDSAYIGALEIINYEKSRLLKA